MRDFSDPEYIAQFLRAWPTEWPPPERVELREGEYREGFSFCINARAQGGASINTVEAPSRKSNPEVKVEVDRDTPEHEWLRVYVDNSADSHLEIAKELGISKRCLEQRLAGKTPAQRKTLYKIRAFKKRKQHE
jgi:hypothetical protein